ncbi:hypothetical protein K2173_028350 [Erythroxylum novogranatense]|uniref:Transcription termination factor MTERF15, mitochondrial n=1 Tax=Erythroxylum novogranatense TaxID=1862640 RepID=A0AAV8U1V6_9ROSI|nr:hypothetical protein K2173_028350 [Erythroxylum novogranatense]
MASTVVPTIAPMNLFKSIFKQLPLPLSNSRSLFFSTTSISRKQVSLANLLQRYGFAPSQLNTFLNRNHFLLSSNLHDIKKSLGILTSFKIPRESIVSLISDCPGVLELQFLKKWEGTFLKFADLAVCPLVIRSVLEHSRKLEIHPDELGKSLKIFKGLGFSEDTMRRVLKIFPELLLIKESDIHRKIDFFVRMGIALDEVHRIFNSFPEVLSFGIEDKLIPLLHEFEDLGFSKNLVRREIISEPQILRMEIGELSRCLELLKTLKCRQSIKSEIFYRGAFRAGFETKLRVDCLCKHGLIRRDAFKVLWKEPRVIIYNIEDIEKKIAFLEKTMGVKVGCLVEVPEYLGVSFEKQIIPRYTVIEHLHAKGALGDEVGLKGMINLSRLRFYNLYVKPYPECEKMYGRFTGVKIQHPKGLWKVFRAERHPETKEDMENIKSFMEGLL